MKLMDIDSDQLGIPDTEYDARVTMPSAEFSRIVRDLSLLGESVRVEVSKEGVRFASEGESANGSVLLRQTEGSITGGTIVADVAKKEEDDEDVKPPKKVKKEEGDEDHEMDDEEEETKPKIDSDGEEEQDEEDEEDEDEGDSKKRKKKVCTFSVAILRTTLTMIQANGSSQPAKKARTGKGKKGEDDEDAAGVLIEMNQHVSLTFSLKYLVNFSKSASLASKVQLMMSNDVPLLVAYEFGQGHIRYYLAPKIGDD